MTQHSQSIRRPFRHQAFRELWAGSTVYFLGGAMQAMATS